MRSCSTRGGWHTSLLALALMPSCTIVGTAISPVAGTVDGVALAFQKGWGAKAFYLVPICIICSPIAGLLTGARVAAGFIEYGNFDTGDPSYILLPWRHLP